MTNPGDSDEWWKQYGGSGVSPESGAPGSVPQHPTAQPSQPSQYPSSPQYPQQPAPPPSQPQYSQQPSQPQYQQPNQPQYPQQPPAYGQQPGYGGYPAAGAYQPYGQYPQPQGTNGLAIGALVSSLIGLCSCGVGAIVGIILGVMALNQIKERGGEGKGMAQAGIWIGVAAIVGWILYILFFVVLGIAGGLDSSTTY